MADETAADWAHGVFLVHPPAARGTCPACSSAQWGQGLTFRRCLDCGHQVGESVAALRPLAAGEDVR
jgi:hypothetical protein